jgi:uncharacterized protein
MNFKLSKYIVTTDVLDPDDEKQERIMFSTRTGISALVNDDFYKTLTNGDFATLPDAQLSRLMDYEVIVDGEEDEFQEMIKLNKLGVDDTKAILMTIQPTANCQLGCFYCGQVHSKTTMTEEIQDKVVKRILKHLMDKKDAESIDVTWYGGEPLMGYSAITNLSNKLQEIATEHNVRYAASMITNGLSLKKDIFTELYLKHNVRSYQITIDTMKEHHDIRRITKSGESTFEIIMKNIMDITSLEFYKEKSDRPIFIRMNIDKTNFAQVTDFIDYLTNLGLNDKVEVGFSPLTNWGDKTAGDEQGFTVHEFAEMEIEWLMYAKQKGFGVGYVLPKRHYDVCMAVNDKSEVYDALGNITPCYEFPYTPKYQEEKYMIGNLLNDESTYNKKTEIRGWYDDLATCSVSTKCSKCNLFPVCGGGCPKNWYNGEVTCPTMKVNIEDKLVLQYLLDKSNLTTLM